jgi:hypothetical protein
MIASQHNYTVIYFDKSWKWKTRYDTCDECLFQQAVHDSETLIDCEDQFKLEDLGAEAKPSVQVAGEHEVMEELKRAPLKKTHKLLTRRKASMNSRRSVHILGGSTVVNRRTMNRYQREQVQMVYVIATRTSDAREAS